MDGYLNFTLNNINQLESNYHYILLSLKSFFKNSLLFKKPEKFSKTSTLKTCFLSVKVFPTIFLS